MPMTMQMIMMAMKHNFGSHCAMICAFARMRTLCWLKSQSAFSCKESSRARKNLRNGQELLDSLEDIDKVSPKRAKDTEVRISKGLHGVAERIEAEVYFPDHPTRQSSRHSKEDIHAHTEAISDVREDISVYGLGQSPTII